MKVIKILTIPFFATLIIASCVPTTQVVLLPNQDGKASSLEVSDNESSVIQKLDQSWQSTQTSTITGAPGEPEVLDEKQVRATFHKALEAQPLQPVTYIMYFNSDNFYPTTDSMKLIPEVIKTIKIRASKNIVVIGYADSVLSDEYNLDLSLKRAKAVTTILIDKGVDNKSIEMIYYGKRKLPIPTPDGVSEPQNRRVEITVR